MSEPRHVAWAYWEHLNRREIEEAISLLNDAGTWWLLRTLTTTPMRDMKDHIRRVMQNVSMHFTLLDTIAEGDRVLLEVECVGPTPSGAEYRNRYCFIVTVWDGTILHVREYMDTALANAMLAALPDAG